MGYSIPIPHVLGYAEPHLNRTNCYIEMRILMIFDYRIELFHEEVQLAALGLNQEQRKEHIIREKPELAENYTLIEILQRSIRRKGPTRAQIERMTREDNHGPDWDLAVARNNLIHAPL